MVVAVVLKFKYFTKVNVAVCPSSSWKNEAIEYRNTLFNYAVAFVKLGTLK